MRSHPSVSRYLMTAALAFVFVPLLTHAADATLDITPSTGTYTLDDPMALTITASSGGQLVNAVEAQLHYNPNALTVDSIARDGSLVSSWTEEPRIDSERGVVAFGGILATSTLLDHATLLVLHVHPRRTGAVQVDFSSGAVVHAADGTGGNILSSLSGGRYRINPKALSPELPAPTQGEVLGAATETPRVMITSPTHPDQAMWYNASSSLFIFQVAPHLTALRLGFDHKEKGNATVLYPSLPTTKEINDLKDGIWYLHFAGTFADAEVSTAQYRVQVDRTPPAQLMVSEIPREQQTDPSVAWLLNATDTLSGIDHYVLRIDDHEALSWVDDGTHRFTYHTLTPGTHRLETSVFDRAGNSASDTRSFEVAYLPIPHVTIVETSLSEGDALPFAIESAPHTVVDVTLVRKGDEPIGEKFIIDKEGVTHVLSGATLVPGTYTVWGVATDASGGRSPESERISLIVSPSLLGIITRHPFLSPLLLVLLFLAFMGLRLFKKLHTTRLPRNDAGVSSERAFARIANSSSVHGQVVLLDKRKT